MILQPQKGPQEKFLSTKADIAIYGGAAGGGKTYALLLEPLRHMNVEGYSATIFRRNATQITIDGGLLDESMSIYGFLKNAVFKSSPQPHWIFGGKAKVSFRHIDGDRDLPKWQGSQICCSLDTPVLMADGSYKRVAALQVGDYVKTLQGVQKITAVCEPVLKECVEVELPNGEKQIQSTNHSILTKHGWFSYDDLFFFQSKISDNSLKFFEYTYNLCSTHHMFHEVILNRLKRIARFDAPFQDYSQSALGLYVYHMWCEVFRHLIYEPIPIRDVYISCCTFELIRLLFSQFLYIRNAHQKQALISSLSIPGHRCLQENVEHTALLIRDNTCAMFQHTHQPCALRILFRRLEEILRLHFLQVFHELSAFGVHDEVSNALILSLISGYSKNYPVCSHYRDGRPHWNLNSDLNGVLQLSDVVVQIQNDLHSYVQGKVPKYTRRILRYAHPYTGEERTAEVDYSYQTLKFTPCGKHWVRNICVSSENHYITKAGLVNKNCYIGFDELTLFDESQFFYMLSRNRSICGVKPYVRATCNPDVDSWVADFISWWINPETGYPILERSGVLRYFCRVDGEIKWGNSKAELAEVYEIAPDLCKSVTFIASSVYDNKILLKNDPNYLANLHGLSLVERERLLNGNWKIVKSIPESLVAVVRAWDLAATEINLKNKDPDRTAGVLMGRMKNGQYIILDVKRMAANASNVRNIVKSTAETDRAEYGCKRILIPQDPGQAGKEQAQSYVRELAGYSVKSHPVSGNKVTRAEPFAAQWQKGNIILLEGNWNESFINELEGFPDALHDDQVDAASDAFSAVAYARLRTIERGDFGF